MRVLHLSDLHITTWNKRLAEWQRVLLSLPVPDVLEPAAERRAEPVASSLDM